MNNVFNLKRFGKYYSYDFNNAVGNFGVSALVIGLLPLILLVFFVIFSLVFTGHVTELPLPVKIMTFGIVVLVVILSAPVKLYGRVTERKAGTDWLMIPASSFEKFLSMAIMLCIVLPVVVFGLFVACDLLLGALMPSTYGASMVTLLKENIDVISGMADEASWAVTTTGGSIISLWAGWCASILAFGLGAICFKKGKAAKTILCIFALEVLLSLILVIVFKGLDLGQILPGFFDNLTAGKTEFWINFLINAFYFVVVGGLLTAIFFRVKTIKQ